jgi:alpha-1,2-mannosyltransferase
MATTALGTSSGGAAAPRSWGTPAVRAAIIGTGATGLALRLWILIWPGLMSVTQYDDGPYFGSAVRLVHGVLPYRSYAFVQPPGITELMSPAALESYLGGTAWALVLGRILTVLAGTAAVVLAGLLVRHRGVLAVLLTGGIMAIYPPAAASARTVLLEPWLVLFCLAGALAVFDGDRLTSRARRLAWGGVAFGFGGAIKVWAIVPVLVIVVLCLPRMRRAAVFAGGVAAGFLIPVLPFVIASPGRFYDDVVVAQLARIGTRVPAWKRFNSMMGTPKFLTPTTVVVLAITVVLFVIVAQIAASRVTRRPPAPLDWFAVVCAALIVVMFLWPPYYASHYSAFFGPFLALSLALPVARLAEGLAERRRPAAADLTAADLATPGQAPGGVPATPVRTAARPATGRLARAGLILLAVAVLAGAAAQAAPPTRWTTRFDVPTVTLRLIPRGSCVLTDSAAYLLIANRFTSDVPGCSQMVDGLGTDLALGGGRRPGSGAGRVPAVSAAWHQALSAAGWVLLTPKAALRIPWNPALLAYFHSHFRLVRHMNTYNLYARDGIRA